MDFIDLIKNYWAVLVGFFMTALWIGSEHSKLNEIDKNQKMHRKLHTEASFINAAACREQMTQYNKINNLRFAHGTEQFVRLEDTIAAKEVKDDKRHSEVMRILLEMTKQ